LIWKFLSALITGTIIIFSLILPYPLKHTISLIPFGDPLVHIFSFGTLMYCYCRSWNQNHTRIILGGCLVVLGIGLEMQQTTLWDGPFEFEDGFANILGVGLGYLFVNLKKY
jgi:glycopeptide antibiotics resistance protein